jgi:hypothetical protein
VEQVELDIASLDISDEKAAYIDTVKGVSPADVYEVLSYRPRMFMNRTERGDRYAVLGPNRRGRYLTIAIAATDIDGNWRLITAYWLRESRGRRLYEGASP